MKKYVAETTVGIFVLIGILAVGYLTIRLGKMELLGSDYYTVYAKFTNVSGLKVGSSLEMAGVQVGQIASVTLKADEGVAVVGLKIRKGLELADDTIASIKTSGLIGDRYVSLSPGGSDKIIKPDGFITETEPAVDIGDLIGKYVFGGVGGKPGSPAGQNGSDGAGQPGGGKSGTGLDSDLLK
jgi:phospholipid/cholesterol/gamma-HCH transport system substrate-binding protein